MLAFFGFLEGHRCTLASIFMILPTLTITHAENYQKTSKIHLHLLLPSFAPSPSPPTLSALPSLSPFPKKVSSIKIIIMKGRPNNLTKTLLRSKSPPLTSRADPIPNKNPERNLLPSQPELTRFSSSDSKPKLTLPLRNDRKLEPQAEPSLKIRVKVE